MVGLNIVAWNVEEVGDRVMNGDETLEMPGGLDSLHDPLSLSRRLMGILRPVIQSLVRTMFDAGHNVAFGRAVGSEFIGDHDAWRMALTFQKLSHQTFGSVGITAALHQHIENEAILIDSSPQPMFLAANGDDDLIEMPFVAEPTGGPPAYFAGKVPTKFLRPKAHGLVRDDDPTRRQQIFNHPETERKTEIEPDGVGNHFSREPVAAIKGITNGLRHAAKSQSSVDSSLILQCPSVMSRPRDSAQFGRRGQQVGPSREEGASEPMGGRTD